MKAKVKMITPPGETMKMSFKQNIEGIERLGTRICIPANAGLVHNGVGYKVEYYVDSVEILIGIGKDHTASLIMTLAAWEALKNKETVNINSVEQLKEVIGI